MRKRKFIEELIDQVPAEKRPQFKRLAAREKYQHSSSFRFLFHGHLFILALPIVSFIFWLFPSLGNALKGWFWHQYWSYGVISFLLACLIGFLTKEIPFKLNQQGVHFVHGVFILGVLILGTLVGRIMVMP